MKTEEYSIQTASTDDTDAILALLSSVDLPGDGVAENIHQFLIAKTGDGEIVGSAAVERNGEFGLLRSVAVARSAQGSGLGSCLTARALERAKRDGIKEILLLTSTAHDFFARCFSFEDVDRRDYDDEFHESEEWNLPRCSSAQAMKLELRSAEQKTIPG